jgi:hypothetical protein
VPGDNQSLEVEMINPSTIQRAPNQFREKPAVDPAPEYRASRMDDMYGLETGNVRPNLTKQFSISYLSDMDGVLYEGTFTTRKLSVKASGQIGVRRSQLNGGYYFDEKNPGFGVDAVTNMTNNMIAHLEFALIQKPTWWNLEEIYDLGLLGEVFKNVVQFEQTFFRGRRSDNADPGGSQDDRSGKSEESGTAGHVKKVGREEVQSSLDA